MFNNYKKPLTKIRKCFKYLQRYGFTQGTAFKLIYS